MAISMEEYIKLCDDPSYKGDYFDESKVNKKAIEEFAGLLSKEKKPLGLWGKRYKDYLMNSKGYDEFDIYFAEYDEIPEMEEKIFQFDCKMTDELKEKLKVNGIYNHFDQVAELNKIKAIVDELIWDEFFPIVRD